MTQEQVLIIINRIKNNAFSNTPENFIAISKEWARLLLKHDFEEVNNNLDDYLETNIYFPKLANLVTKREKRSGPHIPGVEETMKYIESMKEYEKDAASPEVSKMYIERIRKVLEGQ